MTLDEFVFEYKRILKEENLTPELNPFDEIRINQHSTHYCPITLVCHKIKKSYFDVLNAYTAGKLLKLSSMDIENIINSADCYSSRDIYLQRILKNES